MLQTFFPIITAWLNLIASNPLDPSIILLLAPSFKNPLKVTYLMVKQSQKGAALMCCLNFLIVLTIVFWDTTAQSPSFSTSVFSQPFSCIALDIGFQLPIEYYPYKTTYYVLFHIQLSQHLQLVVLISFLAQLNWFH